jgi:cytochrome c oxidase subunit 4
MSNSTAAVAHEAEHHIIPNGVFILVWIALLVLTALTVGASVYFPGRVGVGVAMIVTPIKAALILMYFMHLKYEKKVFVIMFLAAMGIFGVFLGLTFFDYLFR